MRLRVSLAAALTALTVLAVGCNGDEPVLPGVTTTRPPPLPPPTPEEVQEVEDCDDLVPVGISFVENMIQALGGLPIGVLRGEDPPPESIADLDAVGREFDARAARLGCDVGVLNREIIAAVSDVESGEPVTALFRDIIRSGIIDPLPAAPVVTTGSP